ncbi:MAG: FIVAR domain-containing protein [Clostridiales bacterium]|nr:FIVAR domain-containing protein [Clostridiales bacterium]
MNALKKLLSLLLALSLTCGVVSTSFVAIAAEEAAASSEYEEMLSSYLEETEDEETAEEENAEEATDADADTSEADTSAEEVEETPSETDTVEETLSEADETVTAAENSSETDSGTSSKTNSNASSETDTIADTTALESKITEAETLSESDYTAATWTALQTALTAAQTVLATNGVSQTEVDAALTDLTSAIDALVSYQDLYSSSKKISLEYDDRYTFSYKVTSIVSLTITSKRTGSSKADTAVVKVDSSSSKKIIACGCGTAVVTLSNGKTYGIKVTAAPISLLLIIGQSNAEGRPSSSSSSSLATYKKQWIPSEEGQVYSTYAPSDTSMYSKIGWYSSTGANGLTTSNESAFIPSSLTNNSASKDYKWTNNLTTAGNGKSGIDSALAYEWNKLTGEKVWVINAAHHGSSITSWQPGSSKSNNNFWQAVDLYVAAEKLLSKEIAAGHYTLSHKGIFWLQGEQDKSMSASKYLSYFTKMNKALRTQLNGSGISGMKKSIAFTGIIMVRAAASKPASTSDFALTGPRLAQYYMTTSSKSAYSTIYLASQAAEQWTSNANVKSYFKNKYGTQAKYRAANPNKSGTISMPTKISQVHSTIHYTQLAYNELGMDAADNICYALGYAKAPTSKVSSVTIVTANGYTSRNKSTVKLSKGSTLKFAVKVYPTYLSKGVTVTTTSSTKYTVSGITLTAKKNSKITVKAGSKSTYITIKKK